MEYCKVVFISSFSLLILLLVLTKKRMKIFAMHATIAACLNQQNPFYMQQVQCRPLPTMTMTSDAGGNRAENNQQKEENQILLQGIV